MINSKSTGNQMRMQSRYILEIEDGVDPFESSKIVGRRHIAKVLDGVLDQIEPPISVAVDSPWGGGKTKFLEMWLKSKRPFIDAVEINAWRSEFQAVPIACIVKELSEFVVREFPDFKEEMRSSAKAIVEQVQRFRPFLKAANALGAPDLSAAADEFLGGGGIDESLNRLRELLAKIVSAIRDNKNKGNKLVVIIDELDRCKPTFAIEMLEVVKHVFSVEGVAFVFAVDKLQLTHSIRAVYGQGFDANTYLERFFDTTIALPVGGSNDFTKDCLKKIGLDDFFDVPFQHLCSRIFDAIKANYRKRYQLFIKLAVALQWFDPESTPSQRTASVIMILMMLKASNPTVFLQLRSVVMSDNIPSRSPNDKWWPKTLMDEHKILWSHGAFRFFAGMMLDFVPQDDENNFSDYAQEFSDEYRIVHAAAALSSGSFFILGRAIKVLENLNTIGE